MFAVDTIIAEKFVAHNNIAKHFCTNSVNILINI